MHWGGNVVKKVFALLSAMVILFNLTACENSNKQSEEFKVSSKQSQEAKESEYKIPDVFGLNYDNAISILESEGFEVTAIATDVEFISIKLLYSFDRVKKGIVFKVDDYILDNLGNLNKNYDWSYTGEFVSEDKTLIIYYAQDDYVRTK